MNNNSLTDQKGDKDEEDLFKCLDKFKDTF